MDFIRKTYINSMIEIEDIDTKTKGLRDLLSEIGIDLAKDDMCNLILWNDHVNDMLHVMVALHEVCGLSDDECMKIMLEAHEKGRAVAKSGSKEEMLELKKGLNKRNLEVTVEE